MAVEEKKLRRLTIKAYHMDTVVMGDRNDITTGGKMTVCKDIIPDLLKDAKYIKDIDIQVIQPGEHDEYDHGYHPDFDKGTWSTWRGDHTYDYGGICDADRSRCEWKAVP